VIDVLQQQYLSSINESKNEDLKTMVAWKEPSPLPVPVLSFVVI
jgi:hypothetical protein